MHSLRCFRRRADRPETLASALRANSVPRHVDAKHVLALLFPLVGLAPAVIVSTTVYTSDSVSYYNTSDHSCRTPPSTPPTNASNASIGTTSGPNRTANNEVCVRIETERLYTPKGVTFFIPVAEPFSAISNLAIIMSGLCIYLMPFLSNSFAPPHAFAVGILLAFLGAASWAFHAAASRMGGWPHAADRIGMFCVMSVLALFVMNAAVHAALGRAETPRSLVSLTTSAATVVSVTLCTILQDSVPSFEFLFAAGAIVIAGNTFCLLARGLRQLREGHNAGRSRFVLAFGPALLEMTIALLTIGAAFVVNTSAEQYRLQAADATTNVTIQVRRDYRAQHDMLHGTWHVLMAIFFLLSTLTVMKAVCPVEPDGMAEAGREEIIAAVALIALPLGVFSLQAAEAAVVT